MTTQPPSAPNAATLFGHPPSVHPPVRRKPTQPPIAQAYTQPMAVGQSVPNYLVQAILVTIFCCIPFGIVSIIYAAQVNSKLAIGDVAGAMESSRSAKLWAWISFGIGAFWMVGAGLVFFFGLAANLAHHVH
jgi:hypothetical protein